MAPKAWIAGVGMVKFEKPGANEGYGRPSKISASDPRRRYL